MATFTSSLPDNLLNRLAQAAKELKLPKNKIIETALNVYLEQLDRASYIKSYKQAGDDQDIIKVAEEGMTYYLKSITDTEAK